MTITCDHGRKPWKCNECKLEEIKRWSTPTVEIEVLDQPKIEPVKKRTRTGYTQLLDLFRHYGKNFTLLEVLEIANNLSDDYHLGEELTNAYEYEPGKVKLRFSLKTWHGTIETLYRYHRALRNAYGDLAAILRNETGESPRLEHIQLLSTNLYHHADLTSCEEFKPDPRLIRLVWGDEAYVTIIARHKLTGLYRQIRDGARTYGMPGLGKTSIAFDIEARCPTNDMDLKKMEELVLETMRSTSTFRIPCDRPNISSPTLRALEAGKKGDVIRAELLDGSTEFDAFKRVPCSRSRTELYTTTDNCTVHISRACELVIGDQKYQVRFEGKKGHIIPC